MYLAPNPGCATAVLARIPLAFTRYNIKNRVFRRLQQAAHRPRKAAPKWLTEEQKPDFQSVYEETERWTTQTDVRHDVDHIVPHNGVCPLIGVPNVCGLRVL